MKLSEANSVCTMLDHWAASQADKVACRFLEDGSIETQVLSFLELRQLAQQQAFHIARSCAPGDRAILLFPQGIDFIGCFLGCLYSGVVAVPIAPPTSPYDFKRVLGVLEDSQPKLVITNRTMQEALGGFDQSMLSEQGIALLLVDDLGQDKEDTLDLAPIHSDLAFLQYTSGSTGRPKGVMVSHGNLLANADMIRVGLRYHLDSINVSWLPHFHDMGLIGGVLIPVFMGATLNLIPPQIFLRNPMLWLKAISKYRATIAGGPNFAYELCVKKCQDEDLHGLDLSSLDVLFNGAEPVRSATLKGFSTKFSAQGFKEEMFLPCYGMAESTLIISGQKPQAAIHRSRVNNQVMEEQNRIEPAAESSSAKILVGCGSEILSGKILIVDPSTGKPAPRDTIGEIWASGPHIALGYWNNHAASLSTFHNRAQSDDEQLQRQRYLRTGDLGFFENDQLVICGRLKDLIIIAGRNIYPQDIEAQVSQCDKRIRPGSVAAFQNDPATGITIVAEVGQTPGQGGEDLCRDIQKLIGQTFQIAVTHIGIVAKGEVPRTTSGKIQRRLARKLFLSGKLKTFASIGLELSAESTSASSKKTEKKTTPKRVSRGSLGVETVVAKDGPLRKIAQVNYETAEALVKQWLAASVAADPDSICGDSRFADFGLDSVAAVELQIKVKNELNLEVSDRAMFDFESVKSLSLHIVSKQEHMTAAG